MYLGERKDGPVVIVAACLRTQLKDAEIKQETKIYICIHGNNKVKKHLRDF